MNKNNRTEDLLKVLRQKTSAASVPPVKPRPIPNPRPPSATDSADGPKDRTRIRARQSFGRGLRGRKIHFYLHDPDEKLIREIAVWLLPHRKRINDSLVIKTVLRAAKTGPSLLAAYDAAVKVDGRLRTRRSEPRHRT